MTSNPFPLEVFTMNPPVKVIMILTMTALAAYHQMTNNPFPQDVLTMIPPMIMILSMTSTSSLSLNDRNMISTAGVSAMASMFPLDMLTMIPPVMMTTDIFHM